MEIKDLQPRQGNVDITVDVIDKAPERTFEKFGKSGRVCNATVKDATGEVKLTLWNENVDKVNVGDKVKLTNCYVNEYQGEMQLTTGMKGEIEVVGKAETPVQPEPKPEESSEEQVKEDVEEESIGEEE